MNGQKTQGITNPTDEGLGGMRCSTSQVCKRCELSECMCGKMLTFCSIYSRNHGNGPLHRTLEEAEHERMAMLKKDPGDTIDICQCKMLAEDYVKLPEHEGY